MSVSYRDSLIRNGRPLTIEPGVRIRFSGTWNDNNGAINEDDDTWRDSTGLHEDFVFTTVRLEPRLQLEYRYLSLRLSADYSLQFYGRDLSSQLRNQQMEWQRPAVIGRSFVEWAPGPGHLNNRKIGGLDYRVFNWINTDFTHSLMQSLQMNWRGRIVTANMRAYYQYSWVKNPDSVDLSLFHNWEVRGDIAVRPFRGWVFSTNGFYRSNTRSLYRRAKDMYSVSARIAKEFLLGLTIKNND